MINISLNGETRVLESDTSIHQLLQQLGLGEKRLAVEINQQILPRSRFDEYKLQDGDRVEIVQAIGGGQAKIRGHIR